MKNINYLNKAKILIVDDSKAFNLGIQALLSKYECQITSFTNGSDAIDYIYQSPPDIIISDLEMPQMNGIDFIKKIREQAEFNYIPIMLLTSKDQSEILIDSIDAGADVFMSKNSVQSVLVALLISMLRIAQQRKYLILSQQFEAVKALIGTYKHELGNTLAILDGKLHRLVKECPDVNNQDSYKALQGCVTRFQETLKKLSELREYKEEKYSEYSSIVKI
jgi:DNA-binding response OmpR family regulator